MGVNNDLLFLDIDNEEWLIENGELIYYRGEAEDLIIPDGVKRISIRFEILNKKDRKFKSIIFPKSMEKVSIHYWYSSLECDKIICYDTTLWSDVAFDNIKTKELFIHNSNNNNWHFMLDYLERRCAGLKGFESITILDEPIKPFIPLSIIEGFREQNVSIHYEQKSDFLIMEGVLYAYWGNETEVVIPEGVERICKWAFKDKKITNVKLPNSLKYISDEAFLGCELSSLTIPDGVETIESDAFGRGEDLECLKEVKLNSKCRFLYCAKFPFDNLEKLHIKGKKDVDVLEFLHQFPIKVASSHISQIIVEVALLSVEIIEALNNVFGCVFVDKIIQESDGKKGFILSPVKHRHDGLVHYEEGVYDLTVGDDIWKVTLSLWNKIRYINYYNKHAVAHPHYLPDYINYLVGYHNVKFSELKTIKTFGKNLSFFDRKKIQHKIQHKIDFEFSNVFPLEEPLTSEKKTFLDNFEQKDEEINALLVQISVLCENCSNEDKIRINTQIKKLLDKYNSDLSSIEPTLDFEESWTLTAGDMTPSMLKIILINDLQMIINKLCMNGSYFALKNKINELEILVQDETIEMPCEINDLNDKVKYIIAYSKCYNNSTFLDTLNIIFNETKEKISHNQIVSLEEIILEANSNVELEFKLKIDDLYEKVKRFVLVEELFKDCTNSELARDINELVKIIDMFDEKHKEEYNSKFDELYNTYYQLALDSNDVSINKIVMEFRKTLVPFLEEIHEVAVIYSNFKYILNDIDAISNENDQSGFLIKDMADEILDLLNEESIPDKTKENVKMEINKVLSKWKNNIENTSFESEFDWLAEYVENHPEMGFVMPPKLEVTDMVTRIQLAILKDLYQIKTKVVNYLVEYKEYKRARKYDF